MKKHHFVLFIIVCLLNTTDVLSLHRETINFVRLDINDGLSNNEINCMLKDRTGFMWFGTASGLNRFDGYQFKTFRNSTEEALITRSDIKEMYESADSCLWLQYHNAEVDSYDLRTGTFLSGEQKLQQYGITDQIERVFADTDYNLIYQNQKNELIRYSYKDHTITQFNAYSYGADKNDMLVYFFSTDDKYYLIYNSGQLVVINKEMNRVLFMDSYLCNEPGTRYRVFVDREEDLWIYPDPADKRGVYYFRQSDKQWTLLNTLSGKWPLSSNIVRDVDQDMNGRIWIATDHGGINVIDKKGGSVRYLRNSAFNLQSISQNSIVCIYKDDTGIMWAGTYKNGINYYHESIFKFTTLKYPALDSDEQAYNDCSCLYEDERGNIWIGTNGGGLLCFNRQTGKYTKYRHNPADKNSISGDIIISISSDKEGNLWLGSFLNGLNKFDGKRFTHYTVENTKGKLTNNSVYTLLNDTKGKVWIGTLGGGLNCYIPATGEWIHYRESSDTHPLSSDYVSSLIETDDGWIVVATSFGVTVIDNETGEVNLFQGNKKGNQKLNSAIINSLLWDDRQLLWIGTNNGISIYDRKKDTIYVLDILSGLPDNMIMSLKEDKQGNIWVGSRNGLIQIMIQKENDNYHFRIHTFDEEEGIQGRDFNINSVFKNSHDQLLFGGTDGITIVDPDRIRYNMNRPEVVFTDFWVNNKHVYPREALDGRVLIDQEINFEKQVTLKYSERNVAVEFSALNYLLPGKTQYEYKMIGFDKEWIPVENSNRRVQYTNLSPGKYTLMVNARNNDGISSGQPAVLDFVIIPPFYRTYWAILFYFVLVAFLLYLLFSYLAYRQQKIFQEKEERAAIRQMHEIDEMKLRFFTNVSHEFRTPLTLILNPLERLMKKSTDSEDKVLLRLVYQNANQLLTLVNQLLDFRKIDMQGHVLTLSVGDIIPFIRDIVYSFKDLSERKNIRFSFHSGFHSLNMKFDKDKVYKIVVNLLSNAFKFTPDGGEIRVTLSLRSSHTSMDELLIKVIDTGIGIKDADQEKIFERFYQSNPENENSAQGTGIGLHLCKEFVKLHDGEISVESEVGKGSVFIVSLPVITTDVHEIISHDDSSMEESSFELFKDSQSELPGSSALPGSQPALLVIDDNMDFRNFMVLSLQDRYHVSQAPDGEAGWEVLLKEMPDMVICDVMMPGINGFELCSRIKNDIRTSHIPVILLTAKSAEDSKIKGFEAGADDYIGKPFNMDMLLLKIQNLVETKKKMQAMLMQKSSSGIQLKEIEISSLDEQLIQKSIQYIEDNISNPTLNVERLSQEMGMSRVHYYKKIMAITGKAPVELIRTVRLKQAAQLLRKSQKRVGEVALEVGFNDMKLFRKYFKEEFGVLPSDYNDSESGQE